MKKLTCWKLVLLFMCLLAVPCLAEAPEIRESGDYEYYVNKDGTVTISGWKGTEKKLDIPVEVHDLEVSAIGAFAFSSCYSLTDVRIPNSITSIGEYAFFDCENLKSIFIPNTITAIKCSAFAQCINLTDVDIPSSVRTIESEAFLDCGLKSISIPESVVFLGEGAFGGCKLTGIKVAPNNPCYASIENILYDRNEKALLLYPSQSEETEFEVPDGIRIIGKYAFYGCSNLKTITLPGTITTIKAWAFSDCVAMTEFEIPETVKTIGELAFYNCNNLESLVIPASVNSLRLGTFFHCENMKSIRIPNTVTWIDDTAFDGCSQLTMTVDQGSYAASYAEKHNIYYTYPDAGSWLS